MKLTAPNPLESYLKITELIRFGSLIECLARSNIPATWIMINNDYFPSVVQWLEHLSDKLEHLSDK